MAGVFKSLRLSRAIRELSDEQLQAITTLLAEQGASYKALGVLVSSPQEDLRLALGTVSLEGGDPERFLRWLIESAAAKGRESPPPR